MATISIVKGKGNLKHNNRTQKIKSSHKSYDDNLFHKNIIIIDRNIEEMYNELFSEALREFNDKKKRKDRKIKNYYEHICRSKQEKPFYELIIQIDNLNSTEKGSHKENVYKEILKDYCTDFEKRNPNFRVFQCIGHDDEEGLIHFHIDFVPVSFNNARGLKIKNSLSGAFEQMGYSRNGFKEWREKELSVIQEMMKERNIEFNPGSNRQQHLNIKEFKEYTEELKTIQKEIILSEAKLNKTNLEYETKKEFIAAIDQESEISVLYPAWAKRTKNLLGKEFITVPIEKWEAKHIAANEKNYIKKQQDALESEIKALQATKSDRYIESLENENKHLKSTLEAQKNKLTEYENDFLEKKLEIDALKIFFKIIVGKSFETVKDNFINFMYKLKRVFNINENKNRIDKLGSCSEDTYEELKLESQKYNINLNAYEKPLFYEEEMLHDLEEGHQIDNDLEI